MTAEALGEDRIAALLPPVMRAAVRPGSVEASLIAVMHAQLAPAEAVLADLPRHIDPRSCPDAFVPLLLRWLDLERIFTGTQQVGASNATHRSSAPLGRVRELIAAALTCSRWRGTAHGLQIFLRAATGLTGWQIDDAVRGADGRVRAFHLQVTGPAAARPQAELVRRVVASEKPAYCTAAVRFTDAPAEDQQP